MKKVMLITGARKGIGKALAEYYLGQDYLVIGCSRKPASIEAENYYHYEVDVADEKAVIAMIRDIVAKHRQIDVLLNNAGLASMNHFLLMPYQTAQNIINTNFLGTFIVSRETAKTMIKRKQGRIVNFTTVAVPLCLEGEAVYAASKSAIEEFTKITARELGEYNILVNAVGLNPVCTDLIKHVPAKTLESLLQRQIIKRYGEIKDVQNVVDFFIAEKSDFITGQVIYLAGVS